MNLGRRIDALEKRSGSNQTFCVWNCDDERIAKVQAQARPGDQIIIVGWLKGPLQ
jgi:hypothetical protein